MRRFSVQPEALWQLAEAFRGIVAIGIPPISPVRTGHGELDHALDELRSAIEALTAGNDHATSSQAAHIDRSGACYLETDRSLDRAGRFR